jgi:hypothetical protein
MPSPLIEGNESPVYAIRQHLSSSTVARTLSRMNRNLSSPIGQKRSRCGLQGSLNNFFSAKTYSHVHSLPLQFSRHGRVQCPRAAAAGSLPLGGPGSIGGGSLLGRHKGAGQNDGVVLILLSRTSRSRMGALTASNLIMLVFHRQIYKGSA